MHRKTGRKNTLRTPHIERLEDRLCLAAHILGSPTTYATIQAAVDAAAPHAIITVDPGNYPELVGINKSLTIRGAQFGVDARSAARDAAPQNEAVVSGESVGSDTSSGFYIVANDVTIDGFTVQGNTSAGMYGAGIVIAPNVAGTHIINNIIQNNIAGLYLANSSSTDTAVIQYNVFRDNNNPGDNGGRGIYTDPSVSGGNLTNVTIDSNFFLNNYGGAGTTLLEAAIGLESLTPNVQSNIRITNNVMEGNGKALLAYNASNLTITGNTVTTIRDQWSGALRFEGGDTNVTITGNNLYNNTGPAIHIDEKTIPTTNSGFVITGNDIYGNSSVYGNPAAGVIIGGSGAYTGTLDARNNWWGAATGPSGDLTGGGDGLFANDNTVLYSPWSTSAAVGQDSPFNGLAAIAGVPIQAENFNQGGQGFAYASNQATNPAGYVYRNDGIGVAVSSDVGGGYNVANTAAGQWLDYTVNVATAGTYRIDFRVASPQTTGGTFHVNLDGVNVTGTLTAPNTGGWQTYQTISSGTFAIAAGKHILRLVMTGNGTDGAVANFNWFQLSTSPLPSVPQNFALTAASGTELDLSWTQAGNAVDHFTIYRQTGGGGFVQLAQVAGNMTAYADMGLAPNTSYSYQIIATNAAGDSLPAGPITASTPIPPGAPANLQAESVTATTLTLSWQAPANVTGYQITRQAAGGSAQVIANPGASATSFNDSGLVAGSAYQYVVSAFNVSGIGAGSALTVITLPVAPAGLTALGSANQITLTWSPAAGATSYDVYRGTSSGAEAATPITTGIAGTNYVDPGLTGGITYYYFITAANQSGQGAHSSEASAKIVETIPAAPTGLTAGATPGQITLSWSAAAGVTSYNIYRGAAPGGEGSAAIATDTSGSNFTDTSGAPGVTYYYQISAVNGAGEGARSTEAFATVPIPLPAAPAGVSAVASAAQISLSWSPVPGATSYNIYRGTATGAESATPIATGITATGFADINAAPGTTYWYTVTALDGAVEGPASTEASAMISPAVPPLEETNTSVLKPTVSGALPASALAGQKLNVKQTVTLTNSSRASWTGTVNGALYLSTSAGLDAGSIALPAAFTRKLKLAAGKHVTISLKLAGLPASVPPGTYHLVFKLTDSAGGVATVVSAGTITVVPAYIDLTGSFSKVPVSAVAGKKLTLGFTVTNHGNAAMSGLLPVEIDAGTSGKSAGIMLLQLAKAVKLAPGKSARIMVSLPVTASMPASSYLTVHLDPANTLNDANPADNSFTSLQPIVIQ